MNVIIIVPNQSLIALGYDNGKLQNISVGTLYSQGEVTTAFRQNLVVLVSYKHLVVGMWVITLN